MSSSRRRRRQRAHEPPSSIERTVPMSHRIAVRCSLTFPPGPAAPIAAVDIPGGGVIAATRSQPVWTGFAVAGEPVTASTMLGVGLVKADRSWEAHGYDVETLGDGKGSIQGE